MVIVAAAATAVKSVITNYQLDQLCFGNMQIWLLPLDCFKSWSVLLCSFCRQANRVPYDSSPNWARPWQLVAVPNRNSGHSFQAQVVHCSWALLSAACTSHCVMHKFFFTPQVPLPALVCVVNKFLHHILLPTACKTWLDLTCLFA